MVERTNFHERQTQNGGTQLTLDEPGWGIRLNIMSIWQTRTFISFRVKSRYDKELQARKSRRACLVFFSIFIEWIPPSFLPLPYSLLSSLFSFSPTLPRSLFPPLPFCLPPSLVAFSRSSRTATGSAFGKQTASRSVGGQVRGYNTQG